MIEISLLQLSKTASASGFAYRQILFSDTVQRELKYEYLQHVVEDWLEQLLGQNSCRRGISGADSGPQSALTLSKC